MWFLFGTKSSVDSHTATFAPFYKNGEQQILSWNICYYLFYLSITYGDMPGQLNIELTIN